MSIVFDFEDGHLLSALRELEKRDDGEEETHPSTGENRQS